MAINQTMWVLQWERYSGIAKTQNPPPEFWKEHKAIAVPSKGQITEAEIQKLKSLMARFNLKLETV